jgi:hypothetical protein
MNILIEKEVIEEEVGVPVCDANPSSPVIDTAYTILTKSITK